MWKDDRDGLREHEGLARALNASGVPDRRIWNGCGWQEEDSRQGTGLVASDLHPGAPSALRAECQCTWHGPARLVGDSPEEAAAAVKADWEKHLVAEIEAMYPVDVADDMDDLFGRLYALAHQHPRAALAALRELEGRIEPMRIVTVANSRDRKVSWQKIADTLGVSRQSAWKKYQFAPLYGLALPDGVVRARGGQHPRLGGTARLRQPQDDARGLPEEDA